MIDGTVSAFGFDAPLAVLLSLLGLLIGLALAVLFWLTVGMSVYRSVKRTRREQVRDELQTGLLERVFDPTPDWGTWVEGMSAVERDVAESLLDEYLRELDGQNVERLRGLGAALGIPERAKRRLETGNEYQRLYALTWLTLLERPDKEREAEFEPETTRERSAVARLRYESEALDEPKSGILLLLDGTSAQFTVFGQDTLYTIASDDPAALLEVTKKRYQEWSRPLLVQVLSVVEHLGTSVTTEDLSWLTAMLEHDEEAVRAAAARAFGKYGWRRDVREERFVDRLLKDPSPRVREAVYEMLAQWGDDDAVDRLTSALASEENPRARMRGADALVRRRESVPDGESEFSAAWTWSKEHRAYDRAALSSGS